MLNKTEISKINQIIELAVSKMEELDSSDYDLAGATWDIDEEHWDVTFYCDYRGFSYITVYIVPIGAEFRLSGFLRHK